MTTHTKIQVSISVVFIVTCSIFAVAVKQPAFIVALVCAYAYGWFDRGVHER